MVASVLRDKRFPRRGEVFTAREVLGLPLRDSPSWGITVAHDPEVEYDDPPMQDAHVTWEELLSVPGFAETQWRFVKETDEWIPVFEFVGTAEEALAFCDVSKQWSDIWRRYEWWVTPKGFPREYVR